MTAQHPTFLPNRHAHPLDANDQHMQHPHHTSSLPMPHHSRLDSIVQAEVHASILNRIPSLWAHHHHPQSYEDLQHKTCSTHRHRAVLNTKPRLVPKSSVSNISNGTLPHHLSYKTNTPQENISKHRVPKHAPQSTPPPNTRNPPRNTRNPPPLFSPHRKQKQLYKRKYTNYQRRHNPWTKTRTQTRTRT